MHVPDVPNPSETVSTLLLTSWPSTVSSEYGENELRLACSKFLFPYTNDLKQEYRDFKDVKGAKVSGRKIRRLIDAIHTLRVSTAECERGLSKMNLICTPLRSCISVERMSSLLFISIVGPPLREWSPLSYVKSWIAKGRHSATDLGKCKGQKTHKATKTPI